MTQGKIHPPPNPSLLTLLGKVATVTRSRIRFVKLLKRGCEVSGLHRHGFSSDRTEDETNQQEHKSDVNLTGA